MKLDSILTDTQLPRFGEDERSIGEFSMSQPVFSALLADIISVKPVRLPRLAARSLRKPTH